ncbi:MAG: DUF2303 family protein, partial [Mesorhizobium sp.]
MSKTDDAALDAHGIDLIKALATEAAEATILIVDTKDQAGLPAGVPVAFDRKAQAFKSVKGLIEEFRQAPDRRKGTATVETLASFIALVDRHKDDDSVLFGKTVWPDPKLTAVLDYDKEGVPARNRSHRIVYAFPLTEEFKAWVNGNAKPMPQD